ncbi:hypothetical protein ACW9KT_09340 [Hymenobacter sp. HD11105]
MPTTYHIPGVGQLTAASDRDLVEALRRATQEWVPSGSLGEFMAGMALRAYVLKGALVRTDHVFFFLTDLMDYGFVTPIS